MSIQMMKNALQLARPTAQRLNVLRLTATRSLSNTNAGDEDQSAVTSSGFTNLTALADSLASKGYLRAQKPYTPPADVRAQINALLANLKLSSSDATVQLSAADKFAVLNACFGTFEHSVPNSHLHEVDNIADVIQFYETPVNTTLPLDAMRTMDLPQNLHIQTEYVRFTGDTADKFRGQTAFPKSSTLVTGLKYRNKYEGFTAKRSWP